MWNCKSSNSYSFYEKHEKTQLTAPPFIFVQRHALAPSRRRRSHPNHSWTRRGRGMQPRQVMFGQPPQLMKHARRSLAPAPKYFNALGLAVIVFFNVQWVREFGGGHLLHRRASNDRSDASPFRLSDPSSPRYLTRRWLLSRRLSSTTTAQHCP